MTATVQPTLLINATYKVHADDVSLFQKHAIAMVEHSRQRPGCAFFDITQDITDPAVFRLFEGWEDRGALNAHFNDARFQEILRSLLQLRIASRHADAIHVASIESLPMPSA